MFKEFIRTHKKLWKQDVPKLWDKLPLDKKLIWLLVINHTIALITILELFLLKQ